MIQLMNENQLSELELEKEGLKIRLRKNAGGLVEPVVAQEPRVLSVPQSKEKGQAQREAVTPVSSTHKTLIKSPMVGTFYASPAPDAPAFIQMGTSIEPGQVVCIIEAMKLMNEIKSDVRGKVVEILVNNGDPVEFGQPLFVLE